MSPGSGAAAPRRCDVLGVQVVAEPLADVLAAIEAKLGAP